MEYNKEIQDNNEELQEILAMANALPDAGQGGGVGIVVSSIMNTESTADGGINTLEFDLTDGTHVELNAKNGSRGSIGATGATGATGASGKDGADGKDGVSVTVSSVSESTADGGSNVVTFSDGKTLTVKNGSKGSKGDRGDAGARGADGVDGLDGYTPVKYVDYYTEADKAEWSEYIATELAKRGQLKPEFAQTIEDCTDTSKLYVLPDGFIYAYMYAEVAVGGYTNMVDITSADFNATKRYNASGAITTGGGTNGFVSNMFPIKVGDVLRIKGVSGSTSTSATAPIFVAARLMADGSNAYTTGSANNIYLGQPLGATVGTAQQAWNAFTTLEDGTIQWTYAVNNSGTNMAIKDDAWSGEIANTRIAGVATNGFENIIVTVNEEIREPEIVKQYQWVSTGHAFVPADYEDRIVALETEDAEIRQEIATAKAETDSAIADLQEQIDSGAASAKSGARWFALGDSITEGWASVVDTSQSNGYRQFLNTNVAQRWVNIVAEKNGYELTNHGIGGTGFLHTNGTKLNARQLADTLNFSQCDFVTLAYGVNDWKNAVNIGSMDDDIATGGSMVANMRYVIQKILADNPYCKIFVITPINCRSYGDYNTNYGINYKGGTGGHLNSLGLQDIFDRMKEVCDYHGIELIDMTHCSIVNRENIRTMLADYVHPTVECHAAMARELAKKINFV